MTKKTGVRKDRGEQNVRGTEGTYVLESPNILIILREKARASVLLANDIEWTAGALR